MSTVNSFALWGTLAGIGVAVPIIIHLLHQRHRRPWALVTFFFFFSVFVDKKKIVEKWC